MKDIITTARDFYDGASNQRNQIVAEYKEAKRYYDGDPSIAPHDEGRSSVVSTDFRSQVRKLMPSISNTIFERDEIVIFNPIGEEDEQEARQATEYVNQIVAKENNLALELKAATLSAIFCGLGWLTARHEVRREVIQTNHTGLTQEELAALKQADGVIEMDVEQAENGLFSASILRKTEHGRLVVEAVPVDEVTVDPDAASVADAAFLCREIQLRVDEVEALGYDAKAAKEAYASDSAGDRQRLIDVKYETKTPAEYLPFYDVYLRHDADNDGVAELHNLIFIGEISEKGFQSDEIVDSIPFFPVVIEPVPGMIQGESLFGDVKEAQRVKTALLRQAMDSLYASNNPTPAVITELIEDAEGLENPEFGKPIRLRGGAKVTDAIQWHTVPFVGQQVFPVLQQFDEQLRELTGISDASAGLAPKDLQNMTATASALVERAGTGRVAEYVRSIARSLRPFFRYLLRLTIQHSDKQRTIRLQNEWVPVDPRSWNADMDCQINIGLGAGSRERDLNAVNYVLGLQREVLQEMGPINPYVKPNHLYNTLARAVEAAGLQTPGLFFSEPDEQEVQQLQSMWAQKLQNPEAEKTQAMLQIEKAKAQAGVQIEVMKAKVAQARETAQMDADLKVKEKQANIDFMKAQIEADLRKEIEREKAHLQIILEEMKLENERALEMMRLDRAEYDRIAEGLKDADRQAIQVLESFRGSRKNGPAQKGGTGQDVETESGA